MKEIKRKIVSGLLASAMIVGVIPLGMTPVSATGSTMEQAYFQVLDQIVSKHGLNNPNERFIDIGLVYAKLLDFDQDGTNELVVAYGGDQGGMAEI